MVNAENMSFLPSIKMLSPHPLHLPKIRSKHHIKYTHIFFSTSLCFIFLSLSSVSLSGGSDLASPTHNFRLKAPESNQAQHQFLSLVLHFSPHRRRRKKIRSPAHSFRLKSLESSPTRRRRPDLSDAPSLSPARRSSSLRCSISLLTSGEEKKSGLVGEFFLFFLNGSGWQNLCKIFHLTGKKKKGTTTISTKIMQERERQRKGREGESIEKGRKMMGLGKKI
jgi:hypothetical protein